MDGYFFALLTPSLLILLTAAMLAVLTDNWRSRLGTLAAQYGTVAVLASQMVIWRQALTIMLTGMVVTAILFLTVRQLEAVAGGEAQRRSAQSMGMPFRIVAALMVAVAAWYTAGRDEFVLPGLTPAAAIASYSLIAMGLLSLGLTDEPVNVGVSLLMMVNGFHLFYLAVEQSLLVAALLAAVNFGVAVGVSYLVLEMYGGQPAEGNGKPAGEG